MATDAPQLAGDVCGREDEVHHAGGHRAARHPGILRRALVLGERDAALGLDGLQTQDAIGGGSRKDHADGLVLLILRERAQEDVHGHVLLVGVGAWHQVQDAAADGQVPNGHPQLPDLPLLLRGALLPPITAGAEFSCFAGCIPVLVHRGSSAQNPS